jgi:hypothetical protein
MSSFFLIFHYALCSMRFAIIHRGERVVKIVLKISFFLIWVTIYGVAKNEILFINSR